VFVKYVTRNDAHQSFVKEDFAIGLDLFVTSLILLITSFVDKFAKHLKMEGEDRLKSGFEQEIFSLPWLLLILTLGLWATSTVVRKIGWETKDSLRISWGIVFPNFIGITTLIIVFLIVKK